MIGRRIRSNNMNGKRLEEKEKLTFYSACSYVHYIYYSYGRVQKS